LASARSRSLGRGAAAAASELRKPQLVRTGASNSRAKARLRGSHHVATLPSQVVLKPDRVSALAVAEVWCELIQLMVSDVAIGETAPGVAPDGVGQIRQGLQHRYRCPSAHSIVEPMMISATTRPPLISCVRLQLFALLLIAPALHAQTAQEMACEVRKREYPPARTRGRTRHDGWLRYRTGFPSLQHFHQTDE